jgi:hypothetical protein
MLSFAWIVSLLVKKHPLNEQMENENACCWDYVGKRPHGQRKSDLAIIFL